MKKHFGAANLVGVNFEAICSFKPRSSTKGNFVASLPPQGEEPAPHLLRGARRADGGEYKKLKFT